VYQIRALKHRLRPDPLQAAPRAGFLVFMIFLGHVCFFFSFFWEGGGVTFLASPYYFQTWVTECNLWVMTGTAN
jgi:hypothetical protein